MGVPKFFRWISERYPAINQRIGRTADASHILEYFPEVPSDLREPDDLAACGTVPPIDHLYIDFNGILHGCSHNNSSSDGDKLDTSNTITEAEIFRNVAYYLDRMLRIIEPQKLVYIAIDGVAPRAKLNQQRSRRYRSCQDDILEESVYDAHIRKLEQEGGTDDEPTGASQENVIEEVEPGRFAGKIEAALEEPPQAFHSNSITPGTPFFSRCTEFLERFIQHKVSEDPRYQNLEIIFSGPNVPGEGEHKIMQFLREKQFSDETRHCIVGQDGDLILLGLMTHLPNLVLFREQVLFDSKRRQEVEANAIGNYIHNPNFELLHFSVLRDYLSYEFETVLPGSKWDLERCIDDFVFMSFFVGNDFLPHMPAIDIADEAFDLMFYTYRNTRKKWKHDSGYLIENGEIVSGKRLEEFLQDLGQHEDSYFENKKLTEDVEAQRKLGSKYNMSTVPSDEVLALKEASDRATYRKRIAEKVDNSDFRPVVSSSLKSRIRMSSTKTVDDQDLKGRYYSDKFGFSPYDEHSHLELRRSYIEGLVWNLKYYHEGCVSWDWYYPYHYGPMLSDLVDIEDFLKDISFSKRRSKPLKPFEQLLACMPPTHADVLPEPYRPLMSPESEIADFYPNSFIVDMNGKRWPWEAAVLLPFIDTDRLLKAAAKIDASLLSTEEQNRNKFSDAVVYMHDESDPYPLDKVGDEMPLEELSECRVRGVSLLESDWKYNGKSKPIFKPKLPKDIEIPQPGLPTLQDGSVVGLWRKNLRVNVHGSSSRYTTACLEIDNPLPEVLSIETLAENLIGTFIWINYPHFIPAFVTAVSDSKGYIRGTSTKRKFWDGDEVVARPNKVSRIVDSYVFGTKHVGSGGVALVGGENSMSNLEILINVRPICGMKTMPDGTRAKMLAKFEVEVPLFVTNWVPKRIDTRYANLPILTEKDPYSAATRTITDRGSQDKFRRQPRISSLRNSMGRKKSMAYHTVAFDSLHERSFFLSSRQSIATPPFHSTRSPLASKVRWNPTIRAASTSTGRRFTPTVLCTIGLALFSSIVGSTSALESPFSLSSNTREHFQKPLKLSVEADEDSFLVPKKAPPLEFAHGTTTLAFTFDGGIIAAVDSRASLGSFIGSKTTNKVLPVHSHMLGTMAGGAADCMYFIRKLRCEAELMLLNEKRRMSVAYAAYLLSDVLYANRHFDLSVGTMIMGFDDVPGALARIFYVDNTGVRIEGNCFSVGSGSTLALGILDREWRSDLSVDEAVQLGIKAIRYATFRDAGSGGFINVYLITREGGWKRVFSSDLDSVASSDGRES